MKNLLSDFRAQWEDWTKKEEHYQRREHDLERQLWAATIEKDRLTVMVELAHAKQSNVSIKCQRSSGGVHVRKQKSTFYWTPSAPRIKKFKIFKRSVTMLTTGSRKYYKGIRTTNLSWVSVSPPWKVASRERYYNSRTRLPSNRALHEILGWGSNLPELSLESLWYWFWVNQ